MKDEELDQLIDVVLLPERARETLEERVALAEDHRRITDLVMLYGWLCDRRRWDDLLSYYTDDFERTLAGTLSEKVKGKEKLRELYFRPVLPRAGDAAGPPPAAQINTYELRHLIHPPVIRVADDGQTASVAAVYSLVATSGDGSAFRRGEHEGAYLFGMRREPEVGWRFATMTVISENTRNPLFSGS
ncbi:nuclear transport factor 2 family protein [Phytohabitans kaempferiae]|uniref:Nuclear transport factor 2 family protein n=1 Tax=Phytohabitans kaempferiae TaxID=1620943 RepID=A0ABV6LZR7_9ACTN